jgi:hypothetical protein
MSTNMQRKMYGIAEKVLKKSLPRTIAGNITYRNFICQKEIRNRQNG